ncbi:hypothetical protein AHV57_16970 [Salmonella enterica]|uniref:hypothetical protein n=1 Tax=Salmonella enterica TaxID=28901 RepID=UPI0006AC9306|nr:hypothetical protein [Salmonella enterica]EAO8182437.1 hypothetical protein [Salmonella enterica]EHA4143548.1 hypothetical protein [Salmonella enterica]HCL5285966.1 hypothetical protein [Salmonella enterica]
MNKKIKDIITSVFLFILIITLLFLSIEMKDFIVEYYIYFFVVMILSLAVFVSIKANNND